MYIIEFILEIILFFVVPPYLTYKYGSKKWTLIIPVIFLGVSIYAIYDYFAFDVASSSMMFAGLSKFFRLISIFCFIGEFILTTLFIIANHNEEKNKK